MRWPVSCRIERPHSGAIKRDDAEMPQRGTARSVGDILT